MWILFLIKTVLLVVGLGLLTLFYWSWTQERKFAKKGVPYLGLGLPRVCKVVTGKMSMFEAESIIYRDAKQTGRPIVAFRDNLVIGTYYVTDLDLCRSIFVKDFDHFVDRRTFETPESDVLLRKMLTSLESDQWKGLRSKLSPAFTTGKIRKMFNIFDKSSQEMCEYVEKFLGQNGGDYDICQAYSKYAMDVIASCAFGIDSKSFECEPGQISEFEDMAQRIQFKFSVTAFLKIVFILLAPKVAGAFGLEVFDSAPQNYFLRVVNEVMKHRRDTGQRCEDFLQLMMDIQQGLTKDEENSRETMEVMTGSNDGDSKRHFSGNDTAQTLDDNGIVANCVLFLAAGFETTQSLLVFAAYQLALEQECQEKLRRLVKEAMVNNNGKLTYDALHGMPYLDNFLNETLRRFPPIGRVERKCTKEYKVPGTDIVIEKGSIVGLPVAPIHADPNYFDNPEKFNPDRFLPENKSKRHPYTFSPFGQGPRNCIGMRFALTEVKMIVATLVHRFKIEPGSKTDIPMQFSNSPTLKPRNGMWLKLVPLKGH